MLSLSLVICYPKYKINELSWFEEIFIVHVFSSLDKANVLKTKILPLEPQSIILSILDDDKTGNTSRLKHLTKRLRLLSS